MKNLWFFEEVVKVLYIQLIHKTHKREIYRTSLVVQCLRFYSPMVETWVQYLVRKESTFHGMTKSQSPNY